MVLNKTFHTIFEPNLIKEIENLGALKTFKEGDIIMDYGKSIRMMPFIVKGTVKVLRRDDSDKELLLYYLSSNESCSMAYSCCMEAKKSEVKAIAEDDVELIAIPQAKLDEWLCKYPTWRQYIMRSFNERFNELLKSIESIAFHKLDERLINFFLKTKFDLLLFLSHKIKTHEHLLMCFCSLINKIKTNSVWLHYLKIGTLHG